MSLKRDLRLIDEHFKSESVDVSTISSSADKTVKTVDITHKGVLCIEEPKSVMKNNFVPVIIEDWHSDDDIKDELSPTIEGETSGILKTFITGVENQLDCKVKFIRSNNGTKFKNSAMTQFCDDKEAVNNACYVLNKALVTKPHNKTPYELIHGRPPQIDFMKPFGCLVTILNTRDNLGKFEGKADKGYIVGYLVVSKATRLFNKRTKIVEETLNIRFQENIPNVKGNGPDWLFDIDSLTISMNYMPVVIGNQSNGIAGTKEKLVAYAKNSEEDARKKAPEEDTGKASDNGGHDNQVSRSEDGSLFQQDRLTEHNKSTNDINTVSSPVSTAGPSFVNAASQIPLNAVEPSASTNDFEEHSFFIRSYLQKSL
nr:hypothetical protein [Tanacetum cinerariifolium]